MQWIKTLAQRQQCYGFYHDIRTNYYEYEHTNPFHAVDAPCWFSDPLIRRTKGHDSSADGDSGPTIALSSSLVELLLRGSSLK